MGKLDVDLPEGPAPRGTRPEMDAHDADLRPGPAEGWLDPTFEKHRSKPLPQRLDLPGEKGCHNFLIGLGMIQQNEQHAADQGYAGSYQNRRGEGMELLENHAHQNRRANPADIADKIDKTGSKSCSFTA